MARNAYHAFQTFDEILHFWARERPESPAFDQDGRITSYAEADRLTRQLIALFQARGIAHGDPNKTPRLGHPFTDIRNVYIGNFLTVLVHHAID